jgi:hypothetical protein
MKNGKGRQKTLKGVTVSKPPVSPEDTVQPELATTPNEGSHPSRAPLPKTPRLTITNMVGQKNLGAKDREESASRRPSRMKTVRALDMKTVSVKPQAHDAWTTERLLSRSTPPPIPPEAVELAQKMPKLRQSVTSRGDLPRISVLSLNPAAGKALDLVERSTSTSELSTEPVEEMEELYALGNFSDALRVAELILGRHPGNEQAQRCAANSRQRLEQLYSSKIGALNQVPIVALRSADLRWLGLDHRAGFVLSRIDGKLTVEELLEICSMPRLEVLKTVIELVNCGAIFLQ